MIDFGHVNDEQNRGAGVRHHLQCNAHCKPRMTPLFNVAFAHFVG
jgi:hypothetical protein